MKIYRGDGKLMVSEYLKIKERIEKEDERRKREEGIGSGERIGVTEKRVKGNKECPFCRFVDEGR